MARTRTPAVVRPPGRRPSRSPASKDADGVLRRFQPSIHYPGVWRPGHTCRQPPKGLHTPRTPHGTGTSYAAPARAIAGDAPAATPLLSLSGGSSMPEQTATGDRSRQERWASETSHFNAVEYATGPIHPLIIERYARCHRKDYHQSECFFSLLSDVKGKRILDLGCGDGGNAILLALRGAFVTGIDISDKAIEAAKDRAAHHSVDGRTEFICWPVELLKTTRTFDIVIGQAVLHLVLSDLDATFRGICRLSVPGAYCVFLEPVNLAPTLRKLRLM